jgi:alpha-amylase/alpha-mannosidase (GH57 family)
LQRFFDTNPKIIARFPRYKELADKRGGAESEKIETALKAFSEQDFRDLQILFNLAWFDPDFLAQLPLKPLVDKGRDFVEADKKIVFDKALAVIKEVVPIHKELQDKGQIEVITTPYAHPILPLIYDTNLAKVGNPGATMPKRLSYPNDAIAQLAKSVEVYKSHYGRDPRGLWPGEGAVAQEIVKLVADAGYSWMASGEIVLAKSLGMDSFTRDSADTVKEADALYRPYVVEDKSGAEVNMIFRDQVISDKIGFTYSGMPGEAAADDVMKRLDNIQAQLKATGTTGPHLVSIILDGENAWEYYDNDGKAFLNALYKKLSESKTVKTVTPSEYFKLFPPQKTLPKPLFQGAWFSANYDTWIGEDEEALAWDYLLKTREALAEYDISKRKTTSPENLAKALDFMYLAEGSDWFWWFGADQDSGDDAYFDYSFRSLLAEVYKSLGEPVPDLVQAPIVQARVAAPSRQMSGPISPTLDGQETSPDEWAKAGMYQTAGGSMARAEDVVSALYYGLDGKNLYVRADAKGDWLTSKDGMLSVYLRMPRAASVNAFSRNKTTLGTAGTHLIEISTASKTASLYTATGINNAWESMKGEIEIETGEGRLEMAAPLKLLGEIEAGDDVRLIAVASSDQRDLQIIPSTGPAQIVLPDLGTTNVVLTVDDPKDDDKGPGTYTYPTDGVFKAGVFDIKQFTVGYDDKNMVFKFTFYGPVPNPWGSPNNLAVQTLDVYVDKDPGAGIGNRLLLPGRNAAFEKGNGWDVAIWAEGWTPGIYIPDAKGVPQKQSAELKIMVDAAANSVTLRAPRSVFGDGFDPKRAGYVGVVLSQDGFPATGVWRVRDVEVRAAQWRLGGAPADTNHTRILDVAWPADAKPTQFEFLGKYPASQEPNMDKLGPDDFALVPLLRAK